jgi:hypothetical protein
MKEEAKPDAAMKEEPKAAAKPDDKTTPPDR